MTTRLFPSQWTRQDSLGLAGVAAVLAVTGLVGIGPPVVEAMSRGDLRRTLEQCVQETQGMSQTAERLRREKAVIDRRLELSRVTLLPVAQLNRRVMDLVNMGAACGLSIAQVTPGTPRTVRQSLIVTLTVSGAGTYSQISDFLGRLHADFPDMVVCTFSAQADRREGSQAGTVSFELDWYAASEESTAPIPK